MRTTILLPDGRSVPAEAVTGQIKKLRGLIAAADTRQIPISSEIPEAINATNCLETINKIERKFHDAARESR